MSLADKLAATRAASATRIPPAKAEIMHRATDDLRRSGIMDRIVKVGTEWKFAERAITMDASSFKAPK